MYICQRATAWHFSFSITWLNLPCLQQREWGVNLRVHSRNVLHEAHERRYNLAFFKTLGFSLKYVPELVASINFLLFLKHMRKFLKRYSTIGSRERLGQGRLFLAQLLWINETPRSEICDCHSKQALEHNLHLITSSKYMSQLNTWISELMSWLQGKNSWDAFACGLTHPKPKQLSYLLCESLGKMRI